MKITRNKVPVTASKTIGDMIEAFQDKLSEFEVESKTDLSCETDIMGGKEVYIDDNDYNIYYLDTNGMFGQDEHSAGETYSLGEIKNYWNNNYNSDYVLESYDSFDDWWADTSLSMEELID